MLGFFDEDFDVLKGAQKRTGSDEYLFIARTIVESRLMMSCSVVRPKNLLRGMDVAPRIVLQKPSRMSRRGGARTTLLLRFLKSKI